MNILSSSYFRVYANMLCKSCRFLFHTPLHDQWIRDPRDSNEFYVVRRYRLTLESLRQDCYICAWYIGFFDKSKGDNHSMPNHGFAKFEWSERGGYRLVIRMLSDNGTICCSKMDHQVVFFIEPVTDTLHTLTKACLKTRSTGSEPVLALLKYWLQECLTKHPKCQANLAHQWYPSRLLKLDATTVSLMDTSTICSKEPYVTVSHCWGTKKFKTLTTENLQEFETGLRVVDLPATFRDAIRTTARLGFRYIWIDCYCIVQDQGSNRRAEDKLKEIAHMDLVYRYSALNIGAAHAESPFDGMFTPLVPDYFGPEFVTWAPGPGCAPQTYILYNFVFFLGDACDDVYESPLLARAWVMQERILSPRMVYFQQSRILWECKQGGLISRMFPLKKRAIIGAGLSSLEEIRNPWSRAVGDYCFRRLTYPQEDKLAAIGGIAKRLAEISGNTYVAGMWAENLIKEMSWLIRDHGTIAQVWRAPSWSWASLDGHIRFARGFYSLAVQLANIEKHHVEALDPNNPYGAILSARLSMTGVILNIEWNAAEKCCRLVCKTNEMETWFRVSINPQSDNDTGVWLDNSDAWSFPAAIQCLPLYYAPYNGGIQPVSLQELRTMTEQERMQRPYRSYCLITLLIKMESVDVYRRVGLAVFPMNKPQSATSTLDLLVTEQKTSFTLI